MRSAEISWWWQSGMRLMNSPTEVLAAGAPRAPAAPTPAQPLLVGPAPGPASVASHFAQEASSVPTQAVASSFGRPGPAGTPPLHPLGRAWPWASSGPSAQGPTRRWRTVMCPEQRGDGAGPWLSVHPLVTIREGPACPPLQPGSSGAARAEAPVPWGAQPRHRQWGPRAST